MSDNFYRPFLDEVIENQSRLSKYLRELKDTEISETSIPGETLEEKKENLWTTLRRATLGLDSRYTVRDPKTEYETQISIMIRYLLNNNGKTLKIHKSGESSPIPVPTKTLYNAILTRLEELVYSRAVERALKYAPERQEEAGMTHSKPRS